MYSPANTKNNTEKKVKFSGDHYYGSDFEHEIVAKVNSPEQIMSKISEKMAERIRRDNTLEPYPSGCETASSEYNDIVDEMDAEDRKHYLDSEKNKGLFLEEILHCYFENYVEKSEDIHQHVCSKHKDGKKTFTDIIATINKDVQIGNCQVKKGETIAVEVKAGASEYLTSEISHIDRQLKGMPDSSRFLVVTADYYSMTEDKKNKLLSVVNKNKANLIVLQTYAQDVQRAIMELY